MSLDSSQQLWSLGEMEAPTSYTKNDKLLKKRDPQPCNTLPWSQYLVSKPGCVGPVYGKRTSVAGDPTEESTRLPWEDVSGRRQLGKAQIHPWKDNILNPKMEVCKMICLFNWVIFRFDVNFPECNFFNCFLVRNFHGEKKQTKGFEPQKKRNDHSSSQPYPPLYRFPL